MSETCPVFIAASEAGLVPFPSGVDRKRLTRLLLDATRRFPFEVFSMERSGLRTGNVVGFVDAGAVQVEILPKAGSDRLTLETREGRTKFLIDLLRYSGALPRVAGSAASTSIAPRLLEVICACAADAILDRLIVGVPRQYVERRETSPTLRGAPELRTLARRRPGHDGVVPTRHATLYRDNPLTRVVRATVELLASRTRGSKTWAVLRASGALLHEVRRVPLTEALVDSVRLRDSDKRWADVVALARLLSFGRAFNPVERGAEAGLSIVFPLHYLFEAVLRRALPLALVDSGLSLAPRSSRTSLLRSLGSHRDVLLLKPDFLFGSKRGIRVATGDAKWKRLAERNGSLGASPSDLYQLSAYMCRYEVRNGILFYPLMPWMTPGRGGSWIRSFELLGSAPGRVDILGVDVARLVSSDADTRAAALATLGSATRDVLSAST